ncbi:hypothetical protein CR513_55974, partial [Mucuna pruriens]
MLEKIYAKCSKCNQMGHEAAICKANIQPTTIEAKNAQKKEEDQLLVTTCFSSNITCESWLIDSGCTNHMTHDKELFKQLKNIEVKWVKIRNDEHIPAKGKGTIAITKIEDDGNFDRVGRMLNMISEDGVALKLKLRLRFWYEKLK